MDLDYICKKVAKRLYTLRLLKRSSIPPNKLVRVFNTCIETNLRILVRSVALQLPQYLNYRIERIQRRALRIIFPDSWYDNAMEQAGMVSLSIRREMICKRFFERVRIETARKLHCALSLQSTIQNTPFVVVTTNFCYLCVELADLKIVL
jgi:hypothetical protein